MCSGPANRPRFGDPARILSLRPVAASPCAACRDRPIHRYLLRTAQLIAANSGPWVLLLLLLLLLVVAVVLLR